MKILVISDSHGNRSAVKSVFERMENSFDIAVHLGDGEDDLFPVKEKYPDIRIMQARGNCDIRPHPLSQIIETEGGNIFVTHGHMYGVKGGLGGLASAAYLSGCKIALFGHTHCRHESREDGIYLINPGSCAIPHDGLPPSFGVLTVEKTGILFKFMDVK